MASSAGILTVIRGGILLLALIVFLGNIMMWIIMPTDTYYNNWLIHILAHTNSTFFGIQAIMLDFTFPILFIAVLGCLYLHLVKSKTSVITQSLKQRVTSEANYHILKKFEKSKVKIILGRREYIFASFLIHLNVISINRSGRDTNLRFLKKPMIVKGLGIVTITELTLFTMFIALCVWYFSYYVRHWFEQVSMLSMTRNEKRWQTKLDRVAIVTGVTGNLCLSFLFYPVTRGSSILPMLGLTSESSIKYHIWVGHMTMALFTAHGLLYIVYWALTSRLSEMLKWDDHYASNIAGEISLLCGLILWVTTYPNIRRKVFELFIYTHYLYIPFIIFFILHTNIGFACIMLPGFYLFSIDRYLRFLQSRQNVRLISARILQCETVELNFAKSRVHDMLVMIGGGSGITPFISILRELIFLSSIQNYQTPKIMLISVFKTPSHLSMLDLILPISHSISCKLDLQIEAYVTKEKGSPSDNLESIRTVLFKPNSSDAPIFPTLGPNSSLWLCAIISSSFLIFLVLVGSFTRYVIYPVDKNTNSIYSYTAKNSMNIFLICFSIVIASSGVFLWIKKQNANEDKKIRDFEKLESTTQSMDVIELESFPLQSVVESINVHYGQRPNLKRILLEMKESNVGVLVSGPKMLRQDVATICSSGKADNLHFESISFTW
ncbi:hypothetical protein OROGR_028348 [Orobanche gracilis]